MTLVKTEAHLLTVLSLQHIANMEKHVLAYL